MSVWVGLVVNALLFSGAWWVAGGLVRRSGRVARVLACAVLAQAWVVVGLQVLGPWGWLSTGPLTLWSGVLFLAGEATDEDQPGTVEGAFSSGDRAARQLLDLALMRPPSVTLSPHP